MQQDPDDHVDGGISHDLPRLLTRRRALGGVLGTASLAFLAACGAGDPVASSGTTAAAATAQIPEETAGPFPGDGSNGPDVLSGSGVVRSDLTTSFAGSTGTATGVPLTIRLRLVRLDGTAVTPFAGGAVYLWHADQQGRYSLYSEGVTDQNYLRGVQAADADGLLTFRSVFPACYDGRWPHVHFEVYASLSAATDSTDKLRTSQLALPAEVCAEVYATSGYEASVGNLQRVSLDTDMVFGDGYSLQLATLSGSNDTGWTAELTVPV